MLDSFLFDYGYGGGMSSYNAQATSQDAKATANQVALRLRDLEQRVDRLALVNMAMWSLMREKLGLDEAVLVNRVNEIDLQDGKLDGRIAHEVLKCPQCGRTMSPRHKRCLYCGHETLVTTAFDAL